MDPPAQTLALRPYHYRPLESPRHIRLLSFAAGDPGEPLFCDIRHVALDARPDYQALSYEWGNLQKTHRLLVSGHSYIDITKSLYSALRDGRPSNKSVYHVLWADAACINQQNVEERNQQVSIMGSIYRNARTVVTYIGEETADSARGIELASSLQAYFVRHVGQPPDPRILDPSNMPSLGLPPREDKSWAALRSLLRRTWATRAWIVQESLLSASPVILCGRRQVDWMLLPRICVLSQTDQIPHIALFDDLPGGNVSLSQPREVECLVRLGYARTKAWGEAKAWTPGHVLPREPHLPLLNLLEACHCFECRDPHDKVFALLGLAADREKLGIVVDYREEVRDLYVKTATRLIQVYESLDLLRSNAFQKVISLPSWVPDWTTIPPARLLNTIELPGNYQAGGPTKPIVEVDAQAATLTIQGMIIDRISYVSKTVKLIEAIIRSEWPAWLSENMPHADSLHPYPTGESTRDVFWRTLVGNRTHTRQDATEAYKAVFEGWFAFVTGGMALITLFQMMGVPLDPQTLLPFREFSEAMQVVADERRLCTTEKAYLGMVPADACVGDVVAVFTGAKVPFALRKEGDNFMLVGEAYVHGVMTGEALRREDWRVRKVTLV